MAPTLSPWLQTLQAQSEALLLPRLGCVVAAPQLLGPVWATRRRAVPAAAATSAATAAATAAAATAAAAAAARQPLAPPSPVAELPSHPLESYLRQQLFHRIATDFPGVQLVHEEPYVLVVPDFLDEAVCEALIRKIDAHHAEPSDGAAPHANDACMSVSSYLVCGSICVFIPRLWFHLLLCSSVVSCRHRHRCRHRCRHRHRCRPQMQQRSCAFICVLRSRA